MRLAYGFTLVLGGLGLASPLAGQDAPETTPFASPKERVRIALPKSWNAKVRADCLEFLRTKVKFLEEL